MPITTTRAIQDGMVADDVWWYVREGPRRTPFSRTEPAINRSSNSSCSSSKKPKMRGGWYGFPGNENALSLTGVSEIPEERTAGNADSKREGLVVPHVAVAPGYYSRPCRENLDEVIHLLARATRIFCSKHGTIWSPPPLCEPILTSPAHQALPTGRPAP